MRRSLSAPDIALAVVTYALTVKLFCAHDTGCCLEISGRATHFKETSRGAEAIESARERWADRIPDGTNALWDWCLIQDRDTLLDLLACCAALTVNAVQVKHDRPDCGRLTHASALASALALDMTAWFAPTAANYFSRVSREQVTAAITQAKGTPAKRSWDKLKKSQLAALAEREIAGTGWLPQPLAISAGAAVAG